MHFRNSHVTATLAILVSQVCSAQVTVGPDADLWDDLTNVFGVAAVPIVQYDPANGELWINTAGVNGLAETSSREFVAGDDLGMRAISIPGPPAIKTSSDFVGIVDGVAWTSFYINGSQQLLGVSTSSDSRVAFLNPTEEIHLWTFGVGLTPDDFGPVELASTFGAVFIPGDEGPVVRFTPTIYGQVQFVPEPSSFTITVILVAVLSFRVRRAGGKT